MDGQAKFSSVLVLASLILMNGVGMASCSSCCSKKKSVICCIPTLISGLVSGYQVWNILEWVWNFQEYLEEDDSNTRDIMYVSSWLLEHPPPLGIKYRVVMFFLKHVLLCSKTLSVFQKHAHLKDMSCTNDSCVIGKEFVNFMC